MPPRRPPVNEPEPTPPATGTALTLPEDVRADLLRAQADSIQTPQQLPRIKIMPAAAGLFEFADTNETAREFEGIVLNNHPQNVLWDQPYGTVSARPDGQRERPGCVSPDGRTGTPRQGFAHAALSGAVATGVESIECGSCPYNQWGSKHLVDARGGKGKACTNQRAVYVKIAARMTPMQLPLPPTSLTSFDEYLSQLLNRGMPVQAVFTKFTQERKSRNGTDWCQAVFASGRTLTQEEFDEVLAFRQQWMASITPPSVQAMVERVETDAASAAARPAAPAAAGGAGEEDDGLPF